MKSILGKRKREYLDQRRNSKKFIKFEPKILKGKTKKYPDGTFFIKIKILIGYYEKKFKKIRDKAISVYLQNKKYFMFNIWSFIDWEKDGYDIVKWFLTCAKTITPHCYLYATSRGIQMKFIPNKVSHQVDGKIEYNYGIYF